MSRRQARDPDSAKRARETQRRLVRTSRSVKRHLVTTVGLGLVETALIIAQATLFAVVIAGVFMEGETIGEVWPLLVALAGVSVARGLVSAGFEASGRFGASRVMSELRMRLARKMLLGNPGASTDEHPGELVAAAVDGVESLEAYFARYLPQVVLAAIVPIAILAWVFPFEWKAALILAITAPLIPIFMILIGRLTEGRTRKRWTLLSRLSSHFLDLVEGLQTLRAFGRAEAQADAIASVGERYRRETMGALRIGFLSSLVLELLAMLGVAMVAVTIGVQLANGSLGLEAGLVVLLLAPEIYMPLRQLGTQFHASTDGMAAAEQIFAVLDAPEAVPVPSQPVASPSPALHSIGVDSVTVSFPGRGDVLDALDLTIEPGETVGIVGPSGGGKSTLVSLLLRLQVPDAGTIRCGDTDLALVDPRDWRRQLAWVPQRPTLFTRSLLENVRIGNRDADRKRVAGALDAVGLSGLVEELPAGLDEVVGDGGRRLSTGQAQRVAIARALVSEAPMVILDEPTAHLDRESEGVVSEAIEGLVEDRTAIVVSHRERVVVGVDRLIRIGAGRAEQVKRGPSGVGA